MRYVLESHAEFDRLEKQSETEAYDFRQELADIASSVAVRKVQAVLDAGCGSGIVTRYLAGLFPDARVVGCDREASRVTQLRERSQGSRHLSFDQASLEALPYSTNSFDLIVCRYVIQHLKPVVRKKVLNELHRCLKPGGTLRIIDMDGAFFNLFPMSKKTEKALHALFDQASVDMFVGRKLPTLLRSAGFAKVDWDIQTINFRGELKETEIGLNVERFEQMQGYFQSVLGTAAAARKFTHDFLSAMKERDAVFYYNKFIISAVKGRPALVKG
jgi:ubiquinone/menaquinone biosynthesis C-methylase UbiE